MKYYNTQHHITGKQTPPTNNKKTRQDNTMQIPVGIPMKIGEHNGSLRISIPNMIHRMTQLKRGDMLYYKTLNYTKETNELKLNIKIIRKNT